MNVSQVKDDEPCALCATEPDPAQPPRNFAQWCASGTVGRFCKYCRQAFFSISHGSVPELGITDADVRNKSRELQVVDKMKGLAR